MIRSLWTAASGMMGQQTNIDVISNNLSNVNTNGYKQSRAEFEDLLYQTVQYNTSMPTEESIVSRDIQVGLGTKVSATQKMFDQGSLKETHNPLDLALSGNGFFKVILPDGQEAFTRDGSFKLDSNRQIVTSEGYKVHPEIFLPQEGNMEDMKISADGTIRMRLNSDPDYADITQIPTYRFVNPAGLHSLGDNLFMATSSSGTPEEGIAGLNGQPAILQGFLENSNVKVVDAMVDLITAQRAYEFNSKAVSTSDSMLQTAIAMKR